MAIRQSSRAPAGPRRLCSHGSSSPRHGEDLVLSQAWFTIRALTALRDLANALPPQQPLIGVDRPASVLSLLAQFRADFERAAGDR